MTVLGKLMMVITRPLFCDTMVKKGSTDEYSVLFFTTIWFPVFILLLVIINKLFDPEMLLRSTVSHRVMALSGTLNAANLLLIVYASDSSRARMKPKRAKPVFLIQTDFAADMCELYLLLTWINVLTQYTVRNACRAKIRRSYVAKIQRNLKMTAFPEMDVE